MYQGTGNQKPPFHAAGELPRRHVHRVLQLNIPQKLCNPLLPVCTCHVMEPAVQLHIVAHTQVIVKIDMLGNNANHFLNCLLVTLQSHAIIPNPASGFFRLHGQHPDGSGLAGTIGPQEPKNLPPAYLKGQPVHCQLPDSLAIPALPDKFLGQSLNFNHLLPPYYLHQLAKLNPAYILQNLPSYFICTIRSI